MLPTRTHTHTNVSKNSLVQYQQRAEHTLTKSINHGNRHSALGRRTRKRRGDPRVKYNEACVRRGLQEECHVAGSRVGRRHGDDEAYNADENGADNVPAALLLPIRMPRVEQADDAGEGPRWRAHEQRRDVPEAERLGQTGEVGVEREACHVGGEGEHQNIDFDVLDGHEETRKGGLLR